MKLLTYNQFREEQTRLHTEFSPSACYIRLTSQFGMAISIEKLKELILELSVYRPDRAFFEINEFVIIEPALKEFFVPPGHPVLYIPPFDEEKYIIFFVDDLRLILGEIKRYYNNPFELLPETI